MQWSWGAPGCWRLHAANEENSCLSCLNDAKEFSPISQYSHLPGMMLRICVFMILFGR